MLCRNEKINSKKSEIIITEIRIHKKALCFINEANISCYLSFLKFSLTHRFSVIYNI